MSDPLLMGMNIPLVYCRLNVALLEESCDWMQILPVSVERDVLSLVCRPELSRIFVTVEFEKRELMEEQGEDEEAPQLDAVVPFGLTYLIMEYEKREARVTIGV